MISKEDIQSVNARMDVIDILSNFIHLKKKGANYIGNCPFHNEKTGSFTVSPSKQIYKCFGCGKSGNAITFVMEHEKYSYPDAIKWIASKYNIEIVEQFKSDEERHKATEAESLYLINKFANEAFKNWLLESPATLEYINNRGISKEFYSKFELGYCKSDTYSCLADEIKSKHYSLPIAELAGLVKNRDGRYLDSYHSRLIFPIHNLSGKIIGFGGRILVQSDKQPKYINSPENPIYQKNETLYGLYFAKQEIVKKDEAIIVEGYTDVISLHQSGISNVIASSGTSLTEKQIRTVRRFTKNIVLLYDGDGAGVKAILRGMELAIAEGMSVRIVTLPTDHDPDSFIKKFGVDYVSEFIDKEKRDIVDFYIDTQDVSTPEKKDGTLKQLCGLILKIGDDNHFRKKHYAEKACKVFGVTMQVIQKYFEAIGAAEKFNVPVELPVSQAAKKEPLIYGREKNVTKLLLKFGDKEYIKGQIVCQKILESVVIEPDDYYTPNNITSIIHNECAAIMSEGEVPSIEHFIQHPNIDVANFASSVAIEGDMISLNWQEQNNGDAEDYRQQIKMAIGMYEISYAKMNLWMLHNKIDKTDPEWDEDTINAVDAELRKQMREKAKELGLANFKF